MTIYQMNQTEQDLRAREERDKLIAIYDEGWNFRVIIDGKERKYKTRDGARARFHRDKFHCNEFISLQRLVANWDTEDGKYFISKIEWREISRFEWNN